MTSNGGSPEQLTLLRNAVRKSRTKEPAGITATLPVARIAVDVSLPHLDRPFDYLVPDDLADATQPGVRVKVRFAGKDLDGFVLDRLESSDHEGKLARIRKVVSPEQVLTPVRRGPRRRHPVGGPAPARQGRGGAAALHPARAAPAVHVALRVVVVPGWFPRCGRAFGIASRDLDRRTGG